MIPVGRLLGELIALLAISTRSTAPQRKAPEQTAPRATPDSVQPFRVWNLTHGWTIPSSCISTTNWQTTSTWTVPLGLGVSNTTVVGRQPVSVGINYFDNVVRPPGTGCSQVRLVTSFVFPKAQAK